MFRQVIFVAGAARSGTSWLGQIVDSSPRVQFRFQPLFSYAFQGRVNEDSAGDEFQSLFQDMYRSRDPFLLQQDKRDEGIYPRFSKNGNEEFLAFKENRYQYVIEPMLRKSANVTVVTIVRNPCAVINSWMKNPKEFPPGFSPRAEWRHGECKNSGPQDFFGFYKWKELTGMYLDLREKYPDNVHLIRFEDLVADPGQNVAKIFSFANLPLEPQTERFIKESTERHDDSPYSVYKNSRVAHQWQRELDPYIASEIQVDLERTRFEQFII